MKPITRIILTFIAGYCDTATFVHMGGVFSAHVTGNFVLFAADLAQGLKPEDYLKITTFPVFIVGVVIATIIYRYHEQQHSYRRLLWVMTIIFCICTVALHVGSLNPGWVDILVTLLLVFALATQNTLHHFIPGPLTTVMTGAVMNTTALLTKQYLLKTSYSIPPKPTIIQINSLWMIGSFALGCVIAAFITLAIGLVAISLPTLLVLLLLLIERNK